MILRYKQKINKNKKHKIGKRNLYLTKFDKVETKCGVWLIITIVQSHMLCKWINFITVLQLLTNYQFFHEIAPNFTSSQKSSNF